MRQQLGERPLLDGEACCLGSVDVSKLVLADGSGMDWEALGHAVTWGVHCLDNVIDANEYLAPPIRDATLGNRKIGLGMMGVADAVVLLGLRYDSDEGVASARRLSRFVQETAHRASHDLAEQRGAFPNWAVDRAPLSLRQCLHQILADVCRSRQELAEPRLEIVPLAGLAAQGKSQILA